MYFFTVYYYYLLFTVIYTVIAQGVNIFMENLWKIDSMIKIFINL